MELQKRIDGFNKEMVPLLEKYKLSLGAQSMLTEDGRVTSRCVLVEAAETKE
jgi:hypothetical protein